MSEHDIHCKICGLHHRVGHCPAKFMNIPKAEQELEQLCNDFFSMKRFSNESEFIEGIMIWHKEQRKRWALGLVPNKKGYTANGVPDTTTIQTERDNEVWNDCREQMIKAIEESL